MAILTESRMTGVTDQLTGAGPEVVSYVEVDELMVVAYFGEPAITPDGDGGVDIHRERMVEGRPYPLTVDEVTLIAVKEPDGSITLYGFQRDDD